MFYRKCLAVAMVLTACAPVGAEGAYIPPVIRAGSAAVGPKIDGVLDDACWQGCARLTGFKEASYSREPAEKTEVMVCTDEKNLYVAFICTDSQPSQIRALQRQRNCSLGSDDYVIVRLDTLHDHRTHYHFEVNADGCQNESIPSGSAANITWRGDWHAAAKRTDTGWVAEMAIPYSALRYPNKAGAFGVLFSRYIPRLDETSRWPDIGPNGEQAKWADLVDLQLPSQGSRPVFMPYTVSSTQPGHQYSDVGFDYKEELANNNIRMLTYNPDFSDVQDAVASIAYSYTERFLPEQRPFFQEGSGMFPDSTAFYSRRIGDINWGAKTFGKVGNRSIAFLGALKNGESSHFASAYSYDAGPDAGLGLYLTGSNVAQAYKEDPAEPDSSMCVSPGGFKRWRSPTGTTTLSARRYMAVNSAGGGSGSSMNVGLAKDAVPGHLGYGMNWDQTDSTYYVRDAYIPLTGVRGPSLSLDYSDRPAAGPLTYWNVYSDVKRHWAEDKSLHDDTVDIGLGAFTKSEWGLGAVVSTGSWLGMSDATRMVQVNWLSRHLYGGGDCYYLVGKRAGLDYTEYALTQSMKVTPKLGLNVEYQWSHLAGSPADKRITVLGNYELSSERTLGIWAVGLGSDVNLCCTFRQTVRSGSDIYLIYGFPNTQTTQSRVALKIVRPLAW